jgi:pSer/pThr/pTyr-binding forkhead associated (FHA) protein
VSAVAERLLDPSFDVGGFLETRKLVAPPEVRRETHAAPAVPAVPAAKLRGTQVVSMSAALAGIKQRAATALVYDGPFEDLAKNGTTVLPASLRGPAAPVPTSALPQRTSQLPVRTSQIPVRTSALPALQPRATKMLSIGLHAEAAPAAPLAPEKPIEARFEVAGHALPITARLCNIGSAPDAQIRLQDSTVAYLHAQVTQHDHALYLRDAGSQTGTWVNGVPLAGAHLLSDGDRVVVGRTELTFRSAAPGKKTSAIEAVIALPRLELRSGPSLGLSFVLSGDVCTLGSGHGVSLQVFEPSVAPLHAQVRAVQGHHYLSDAGSPSGTYARGVRLAPGQEMPLGEGEVFQIGAVAVAYTRAPTRDRVAAFRPLARLSIASGAGTGQSAAFDDKLLVGSAPGAGLPLPGAEPHELELLLHQTAYFVRDLTGGRTFKSGSPLGPEWAPLRSGEILLASTGAMLRFEEP